MTSKLTSAIVGFILIALWMTILSWAAINSINYLFKTEIMHSFLNYVSITFLILLIRPNPFRN
jgi:hypothetical protein